MYKIISMSLYGHSLQYKNGVFDNIKLLPEIFPEWTLRIYCNKRETDITEFKKLGCEIHPTPFNRGHSGMFWRFLAAWDPEAERVLFRDADSRFNIREKACVEAWEKSGLNAHCMKDHLHHAGLPIFGGMWGIKCRVLPYELKKEVLIKSKQNQKRVADMYWLQDKVHPLIENSLLRHSSVPTKWPSVPFPIHPKYKGFVGQQYDQEGNQIWPKV